MWVTGQGLMVAVVGDCTRTWVCWCTNGVEYEDHSRGELGFVSKSAFFLFLLGDQVR